MGEMMGIEYQGGIFVLVQSGVKVTLWACRAYYKPYMGMSFRFYQVQAVQKLKKHNFRGCLSIIREILSDFSLPFWCDTFGGLLLRLLRFQGNFSYETMTNMLLLLNSGQFLLDLNENCFNKWHTRIRAGWKKSIAAHCHCSSTYFQIFC